MSSKVPESGVHTAGRRKAQGGVSGDQQALRDYVSGNRDRPRPRAFSGAKCANAQSEANRANHQEDHGGRNLPRVSRSEEAVMGRGIVDRRVFHRDGRAAWQ